MLSSVLDKSLFSHNPAQVFPKLHYFTCVWLLIVQISKKLSQQLVQGETVSRCLSLSRSLVLIMAKVIAHDLFH